MRIFIAMLRKSLLSWMVPSILRVTGEEHDQARDNYLRELGLTVLRYSNRDMKENYEGVGMDILQNLSDRVGFEVKVLR